jgi:hypothetical protein
MITELAGPFLDPVRTLFSSGLSTGLPWLLDMGVAPKFAIVSEVYFF